MGIFKGVFQIPFGSLGEGVLTVRDECFRDQEVSAF